MRTKLVYLITCLWLCAACSKDEIPAPEALDEFTDPNFIELLHNKHKVPVTPDGKINLNDEITLLRLRSITDLNTYSEEPIQNITGIRNLVSLDRLFLQNRIATLDVSDLKNLTSLECRGWALTQLTIRNTPQLKRLVCYGNQLTSLDLAGHPQLEFLDCSRNELTSLDLAGHPQLEFLYCSANKLTTLNITELPKLCILECNLNHLSTLDASRMQPIPPVNKPFKLKCGEQSDENGNERTLHLILGESHKEAWEKWIADFHQENVEITFKP